MKLQNEHLKESVYKLRLRPQAHNALIYSGILQIGQLVQLSIQDLMTIQALGVSTIYDILNELNHKDLGLNMNIEFKSNVIDIRPTKKDIIRNLSPQMRQYFLVIRESEEISARELAIKMRKTEYWAKTVIVRFMNLGLVEPGSKGKYRTVKK